MENLPCSPAPVPPRVSFDPDPTGKLKNSFILDFFKPLYYYEEYRPITIIDNRDHSRCEEIVTLYETVTGPS